MSNFPKLYGKVLVGERGQIVIPAEARKFMGIKPGDYVVIISGPPTHERAIAVIAEEEFNKFLRFVEEHIEELKKGTGK